MLDREMGVVAGISHYLRLNDSTNWAWELIWKPVCASTEIELSNWIKDRPIRKNEPRAFFSSRQNYGQGQHGRYWYSPKGGVWVSAAIKSDSKCEYTSELYGLALALSLANRLELQGINVKIKWPNDLLVNGQKLAGILPRLFFRGKELRLLRVGVGLNVSNKVPKEGIALEEIIGSHKRDLNFWSSEVLCAIERSLDLLGNQKSLCKQVEQRLWTRIFIDQESGFEWNINGIEKAGGLHLSREGKERIWRGKL